MIAFDAKSPTDGMLIGLFDKDVNDLSDLGYLLAHPSGCSRSL